MNNDPSG